jgi:hypothetical protein
MNMLLSEALIRQAVAIFLALIAGYLDGYGFLFLRTYVSFMSENTTIAGLRSGRDNVLSALPSAIAVFSFVTGSFFGNFFSQSQIALFPSPDIRFDCRPARNLVSNCVDRETLPAEEEQQATAKNSSAPAHTAFTFTTSANARGLISRALART